MFTILLILALAASGIWTADYKINLEDLYFPCTDGPPGSINLNEAFNLDDMEVFEDFDGIHVSGNVTTNWSFPRTDRISARFNIMHFNRGNWEPTVFNLSTRDFCESMLEKSSYWFKYWFQYFLRREDLKRTCIATKDTVLEYSPFVVSPRLNNVIGPPLHGRYKAVVIFEAFDENNKRRPTCMCFELRGVLEKITK